MLPRAGVPPLYASMTEPVVPAEPSPASFVPVGETLRELSEQSWRGDRWPRQDLLWLLAVTALAGGLRLWHMEQWSLSVAEAETWRGATESLGGREGFFASGRSNYPLVFLCLRWLMDVGALPFSGEGWLRLPFAFFGILSVPLLALVGDLFVGRRAALLAATMFAVHPWHVQLSQTASPRVVALFFAIFAAGTAVVALRMRDRWAGVFTIALWLLAVGCDPSGWLALLSLGLAMAWHGAMGMAKARRPVLALVVAVPLFLPAVVAWLQGAAPMAVFVPWRAAGGFLGAFRPPILLLALVGLLLCRGSRLAQGLLAALALPIGASLLVAGLTGSVDAGLALPALPAAILLASVAAQRACELVNEAMGVGRTRFVRLPGSLFGIVCGLDLAVSTYLYTTVEHGQRAEWRTARDVVRREAGQEPDLWVVAGRGFECLSYYLRPNHWRDLQNDAHPGRNLVPITSGGLASSIEPLREQAGAQLFVVLSRGELDAIDAVPADRATLATFHVVGVLPGAFSSPADTLYVYRAPASRAR
jgi:hypothetical protein